MSAALTSARTLLRCCACAALAVAWLAASALPARAEVTEWGVQTPRNDAVVIETQELVVYVNRTASPDDERVEVHTRMLDEAGEPLSEETVALELTEQIASDPPGNDQLRYTGTIDPNEFAWLDGAIAPNGRYTLQVQLRMRTGEFEREPSQWRDHLLRLDAPAHPAGAVTAKIRKAEAKRVKVAWEPSPSPDLSHYILERRVDGGPWSVAQDNLDPTLTSTLDEVEDFGDYRYRVIAVRPSGDGSGEVRTAESPASPTVEIEPEPEPPPPAPTDAPDVQRPGDSTSSGAGPVAQQAPSSPRARAPADANQIYKGPLDYGVEPTEVTERVPVRVAKGGGTQEGGVLQVVDRSIDRQRVLPAVAGGLILVLSAAHVVRFLNE